MSNEKLESNGEPCSCSELPLCVTDNCLEFSLIENFEGKKGESPVANLRKFKDGRMVLATFDKILSCSESMDIIDRAEKHNFQNMDEKYSSNLRNNSRLLVRDGNFATRLSDLILPSINKLFEKNHVSCEPLGFGVTKGQWELEGLNEAFRINKYSECGSEFFSPHRDAQYCPNGDRRSLLTLLVYLNSEFEGGYTQFYFPKTRELTEDVSIREEIESFGGLENGYFKFAVRPSPGKAVIFSQDILHESTPVTKGTKYVLKTDVVVKRIGPSLGFSVSKAEQEDYMKCLTYFREAQQQELRGNALKAGELYEGALSIRYCYPMKLKQMNFEHNSAGLDYSKILPSIIWHELFDYLSGFDIENILRAFPHLSLTQKAWERYRYNSDENSKNEKMPKYIPQVQLQHGIFTKFDFNDASFFFENEDGCLRVAAMYAFFLLSHKKSDQVYTVRYNPENQEVCAVALKSLLRDAFLNRPCYGSIYAVWQTDPEARSPEKDFNRSVEEAYMAQMHQNQSAGMGLINYLQAKTKLCSLGDRDLRKEIAENASESDSDDLDISDSDGDISDSNDDDNPQQLMPDDAAEITKTCDDSDPGSSVDISNKNQAEFANDTEAHSQDQENSEKTISSDQAQQEPSIEESCHENDLVDDEKKKMPTGASLDAEICNLDSNAKNDELPESNHLDVKSVIYPGYSDSDDANSDVNEEDVDDINQDLNLIKDLKEHIKDNPDDDWFVHSYDTQPNIIPTMSVFKEIIYQSNIDHIFTQASDGAAENLAEYVKEKYEEFSENSFTSAFLHTDAYYNALGKVCEEKAGVSVALLSVLQKPTVIEAGSICLCYWPGGEGYSRIRKACNTSFCNHLVFDFLGHEMKIKKAIKDCNSEGEPCFYADYLDAFIKQELDKLMSVFHHRIDISEILKENSNGFNHASCNCYVPAFKIMEYCNLKSYPYLDHIHLVGGEDNGHVTVWAIYGGIAAL